MTLGCTALMLVIAPLQSSARKVTVKYKRDKKEKTSDEEGEMVRGSFMVASQCEDCNKGYRLQQIEFTGYDKPGRTASESFFITNRTDRTMSGVTLYIDYRTPDGRQLHKQFLKLSCDIPPGETRRAEIKSWDTQRSFHYELSAPGRRTQAFRVTFDPVAYYLRY